MIASDIINRASRILYDLTKVRWTEAELLDYVNDAQLEIVNHRPDANSVNATVTLAVGSKQTIPTPVGIRFLRAVRNISTTGAIRETSRVVLDSELPDWHTGTAAKVLHYVFDNVDPKNYYVYPAVTSGVQIEIIYSALPVRAANGAATLTLSDQYQNAVLDWVLYRCWSKDAAYAGNMQRALSHVQSFANSLGISMQANFLSAAAQQATPTPAAAPFERTGG